MKSKKTQEYAIKNPNYAIVNFIDDVYLIIKLLN
jgi:hypothetical protein